MTFGKNFFPHTKKKNTQKYSQPTLLTSMNGLIFYDSKAGIERKKRKKRERESFSKACINTSK